MRPALLGLLLFAAAGPAAGSAAAQRTSGGVYNCPGAAIGSVTEMMQTGLATWRCIKLLSRVDTVWIATKPETVYVVKPDTTPPATPPVQPSGEPAGLTTLFDAEAAAAQIKSGSWAIERDNTAPRSAADITRITYPAGMAGGVGPANLESGFTASRTLYVALWLRASSNFAGHPTGINKVIHLWVCGGNRVVPIARGFGDGALTPTVGLQGLAAPYTATGIVGSGTTSLTLLPQQAVTFPRGTWQRWEFTFVGNTSGAADGSATWAVDGVTVGNYSGIRYCSGEAAFSLFKLNPTWGGTGSTVPATMWLDVDHLRVSGR